MHLDYNSAGVFWKKGRKVDNCFFDPEAWQTEKFPEVKINKPPEISPEITETTLKFSRLILRLGGNYFKSWSHRPERTMVDWTFFIRTPEELMLSGFYPLYVKNRNNLP